MTITIKSSLQSDSGTEERILRLPHVKSRFGVGRASIYAGVKKGTFPAPIKLGERAVGWLESELLAWVESRKADRQQAAV